MENEKFRDIVLLAPQNKNQYLKLSFQFLREGLVIYTTANKGEEGLDASLEFIESLHNYLQQQGISHDVYEMNCGRIDRIDRIVIHLMPALEPVLLKERKYSYIAIKPNKRNKLGGSEAKGTVMAKNMSEAINKVRDMGYFPIKVTELKRKA
ncbi:hypothetical protein HYT92_01245 [Candidatus Pacearchaeota archaeon]|nr:hypothetical protein [Candidatus Pacearchaeota archaeon]